MKTSDPDTWDDISSHPTFGGNFDPNWYEGDLHTDLAMLRKAAKEILSRFPNWSCELVILDDCTMFVTVHAAQATICSIFLSENESDRRCFFLDVEGDDREMRVDTIVEIITLLTKM